MAQALGGIFERVVLPDGLKLLGTGKQFLAASYENIMMMVWVRPPDVAAFEVAEKFLLDLIGQTESGLAVMVIALTADAPASPRETNARSAAALKKGGSKVKALANYFASGDIKGRLISLSMNIVAMLSTEIPQKSFSNLTSASEWVDETLRKSGTAHPPREKIADAASRLISAVQTGVKNA